MAARLGFFLVVVVLLVEGRKVGNNVSDPLRCPYFPKVALIGIPNSATSTVFGMVEDCIPLCYLKDQKLNFFDRLVPKQVEFNPLCRKYSFRSKRKSSSSCLALDGTTSNSILPSAAKFFSQTRTKVFAIFRDPIDRLVSMINKYKCKKDSYVPDLQHEMDVLVSWINKTKKAPPLMTAGGSSWGTIIYSLYDYVLDLYPLESSEILFFDDLKENCTAFAIKLSQILHWPTATTCLINQCGIWEKRGCHLPGLFRREDIPPNVQEFILQNNVWWSKIKSGGVSSGESIPLRGGQRGKLF